MNEVSNGEQQKLSKTLTGIAGEYFVAAELSRRGFTAAVTLRNTRGIDILASRPGGKTVASIQVKTLQGKGLKWRLDGKDETPKGENHYYVFVALNGPGGKPDYFVVEGNHVAKCVRSTHQKWLKGTKKDGGKRKDTSMRVFCPDEACHDAWNRIRV